MSLLQKHLRAAVREDTPDTHRVKHNTPTMGGLLIVAVALALWAVSGFWTVSAAVLAFILLGFCAIGAWDDWTKIKYKKGISERKKFVGQVIVATLGMTSWWWLSNPSTVIQVPLFSFLSFDAGPFFFIFWAVWVIVCTVNAVNFTDGLDGLAALTLGANFVVFGILAYVTGHADIAFMLTLVTGSLLGFLWFNCYPAQIFMGDAGSLALGAVLATSALMIKQEFLIPIAGAVFVLEGVSVAAQIVYYKATKRRLFKMAPLHHHLELSGWPETKITLRFFILTLLSCAMALCIFACG